MGLPDQPAQPHNHCAYLLKGNSVREKRQCQRPRHYHLVQHMHIRTRVVSIDLSTRFFFSFFGSFIVVVHWMVWLGLRFHQKISEAKMNKCLAFVIFIEI